EDLRQVLDPQCAARARAIAVRMSKPAESVTRAADLMEGCAGA
ncbi:MAG: glycosyltransferase, partial [Mycobacterium sp.]